MLDSPYWLGFSASSWGTSWGYDVTVDEPLQAPGGGPLGKPGRSTRKSGGPWQSLDQIKDTALTWDRDEDVLLLLM